MFKPIRQVPAHHLCFAEEISITREGEQADLGKSPVIHIRWLSNVSLMFEMARSTFPYVGMKGRRLTLQERFLIGMAKNTLHRIHSHDSGMTGPAILFQRSMDHGELPWTDESLPGIRYHRRSHADIDKT
ncbi:MAG: hypothetical protein NPIRA01_04380 [Nitrospirales bacterium]|nr:MAG: hypothetical protein NPIRA01_04380 [Nitrospirales bacterium]